MRAGRTSAGAPDVGATSAFPRDTVVPDVGAPDVGVAAVGVAAVRALSAGVAPAGVRAVGTVAAGAVAVGVLAAAGVLAAPGIAVAAEAGAGAEVPPATVAPTAAVLSAALPAALPTAAPEEEPPGAGAPGRPPRPDGDTVTVVDDTASWSFSVGEEAVYRVAAALGPTPTPHPVGRAHLRLEARDTVAETGVYRASLETDARIPMVYTLENRRVSWMAPDPLRTLQFEEELREGDHRRHRLYRLRQDAGTYTRYDREGGGWRAVEGRTDVSMPPRAMDELAFLYFVRTLPLEPGRIYRLHRYFEEDGNPVVLEVLRRERVRVPAGTYETVVVRPVIRTSGLFSEEGRAEVFLSDDDRRLVVAIRSRMRIGRVHFMLESYRPGEASASAAGAASASRPAGPPAGTVSPAAPGASPGPAAFAGAGRLRVRPEPATDVGAGTAWAPTSTAFCSRRVGGVGCDVRRLGPVRSGPEAGVPSAGDPRRSRGER